MPEPDPTTYPNYSQWKPLDSLTPVLQERIMTFCHLSDIRKARQFSVGCRDVFESFQVRKALTRQLITKYDPDHSMYDYKHSVKDEENTTFQAHYVHNLEICTFYGHGLWNIIKTQLKQPQIADLVYLTTPWVIVHDPNGDKKLLYATNINTNPIKYHPITKQEQQYFISVIKF